MAKRSNRQYAQALYEITRDLSGDDLSSAIAEFVKVLVRDQKIKQTNNIIVEFEKYVKKQAGISEIEITSAHELDNSLLESIKQIFGDKTEAVTKNDPSLIGGISIRTEDKILDGSVRTQLQSLKQSLI